MISRGHLCLNLRHQERAILDVVSNKDLGLRVPSRLVPHLHSSDQNQRQCMCPHAATCHRGTGTRLLA
jgi:hypothetical protein